MRILECFSFFVGDTCIKLNKDGKKDIELGNFYFSLSRLKTFSLG